MMDLIELYTKEIGRQLPEKMRADIEKEIHSLIEDNLEDEAEKAGRAPDEAMVAEVLKRMGPPDKVAASYLPPRYLIGPELYPHFIQTLRIVLSVVTVLTALALGVSAGASAEGPFDLIGNVIGGLLDSILHATGIVVLIFAIIQLTSPGLKMKPQEWDPLKMKAEPDPERVSIPEALAEIVSNTLALVIFNLYPQWIGVSTMVDGVWVHVPALTETFFTYLPWLSLLWAGEVGMNMWLVMRGKWTQPLRWVSITISILTIAVLVWMLAGPAIISLSASELTKLGWAVPEEAKGELERGVQTSVRLVIGIILALQVVDLGKQGYKMIKNRLPG